MEDFASTSESAVLHVTETDWGDLTRTKLEQGDMVENRY